MTKLISLLLALPGLLVAVTFHEMAHGWVARLLGDTTAERMGRLSFNPFRHVDLAGSIILPAVLLFANMPFIFGYAKPVPVDFERLKYGPFGTIAVALAGPLTNFILAFICTLGWALLLCQQAAPLLIIAFQQATLINLVIGVFNLIPFPPLDGSRVITAFFPKSWGAELAQFERIGVFIFLIILILSSFEEVTHSLPLPPIMTWVRAGATFGLSSLSSAADFCLSSFGLSC